MFDFHSHGLHKFISPREGHRLGDSIIDQRPDKGGGGAYAPYQLPDHSRQTATGKSVVLHYLLSTWNPYQVVLMRHVISSLEIRLLQDGALVRPVVDSVPQEPPLETQDVKL